jgi:hypothetical protein
MRRYPQREMLGEKLTVRMWKEKAGCFETCVPVYHNTGSEISEESEPDFYVRS